MYRSLVGQVVETFAPHTEAAPVAIAAQFLVGFGSAVGPGPRFYVGETPHPVNEFLLVVGSSSRSRKGESLNSAKRPLVDADPEWAKSVAPGLSSGEGLIFHLRDPVVEIDEDGNERIVDAGVADKRLLVVETEFAAVLKQFTRRGNVLSPILRAAWDASSPLRTLTKNQPLRATGAHVSLIAHCTPEDLHAHFTDIDVANGLGNRFLIVLATRSQILPDPGRASQDELDRLAERVSASLIAARAIETMRRSPEATEFWHSIYPELTRDLGTSLVAKLLARAEAHVLRLSALYALCEQSQQVERAHIESALALWEYAELSVRRIFKARTGNWIADRLMTDFPVGTPMSLGEVRRVHFSNHAPAAVFRDAIEILSETGEFQVYPEPTSGRPREMLVRVSSEDGDPMSWAQTHP